MTADIDNGIVRMEFSVSVFIGFADSCNVAYYIETLDKLNINMACVTDKTEDGIILSVTAVDFKIKAFKPFNKILYLSFVCSFLMDTIILIYLRYNVNTILQKNMLRSKFYCEAIIKQFMFFQQNLLNPIKLLDKVKVKIYS